MHASLPKYCTRAHYCAPQRSCDAIKKWPAIYLSSHRTLWNGPRNTKKSKKTPAIAVFPLGPYSKRPPATSQDQKKSRLFLPTHFYPHHLHHTHTHTLWAARLLAPLIRCASPRTTTRWCPLTRHWPRIAILWPVPFSTTKLYQAKCIYSSVACLPVN